MKIRFVNLRKMTSYRPHGWLPYYQKYWSGKCHYFMWRGFGLEIDTRSSLIKELLTENEYKDFLEKCVQDDTSQTKGE